jgi:ssDNA-binding Zn-finger/Zn-ribbon topoisomerase 1
MVLRTAKTGANQGGKFWGCSNFPRCRGVLKYEQVSF